MSESLDSSLSSTRSRMDEQSHLPSASNNNRRSSNTSTNLLTALIDPVKSLFAGSFGGFCSLLVGHPFDTIKVRLQTIPYIMVGNNIQLKNNTLDCVRMTVKYEGFLGLYKGFTPILLGVLPSYSTYFFGYTLGLKIQNGFASSVDNQNYKQIFLAGAFAGAFGDFISIPCERLKCLLQVQTALESTAKAGLTAPGGQATATKFNGMVDCAKQLYRTGGIKSLYRGTFITLVRDIPTGGVYITCYTYLKNRLNQETPAANRTDKNGQPQKDFSVFRTMVAGGLAGMASSLTGLPFDVIKSRFQSAPDGKYQNARQVLRELLRKDGVMGLYKGLPPVLIRTFPANAACFLGYELTQTFL